MKNYLLSIFIASMAMTSCTKNGDNSASISDATLSTLASSSDLSMRRSLWSNENVQWNIRMNDVAAKAYADGKKDYPVNSMLVKEKHDGSGTVIGFDIMYKAPGDPNASGGWLYSSVNGHGQVIYGVDNRGSNCNSCHASTKQEGIH